MITFAHLADCHLGSYREPRLRELGMASFSFAIDHVISRKADFAVIAGDLFNTAVPSIDILNFTVQQLSRLKEKDIPVYMICGSHDYSPGGKTMVDVLESAGLVKNVMKGSVSEGKLHLALTVDEKTGTKLTGILGRRNMLDSSYYESLDHESLEKESGFKIFLFHTALQEFKPKGMEDMDASPLSLLPKGFHYYAGGHVHMVFEADERGRGYGKIVYPGPIFPNSFKEIEDLKCGTFRMVSYHENSGKIDAEVVPIALKRTISLSIDCNHKTPHEIDVALAHAAEQDIADAVVTLRLHGTLGQGKASDIHFADGMQMMYDKGAYLVLRNTSSLSSEQAPAISVGAESSEHAEESLIAEQSTRHSLSGHTAEEVRVLTRQMMRTFLQEKKEGEKSYDFESRLKQDADTLLEKTRK